MLKKVMIPLALLILSSIIAFWTQSPTFAAPGQQSPLPAPGAEAAELAELIDRIAALEAQVAALEEHAAAHQAATVPAGQVNRVTTAIYLLDNAGLHDLDVRLNEEGEILPGDAGQIARLSRLLSAVDWPEALAGNAEALITTLGDLQAALAGDDAEAAAPLAFDAHEIGHTLSHDAEHWLGEALGGDRSQDSADQLFSVTAAIYLLDNAGLHDLDVRLNEEGEILPGDAGQVTRLNRLLSAVVWPEALAGNAEALMTTLAELATALADDDAEAAAPLAFDVHEIGHTLSHDAEHWLGEALGAGHGHSDDEDSGDEHGAESEETGDAADDESGD